MARDWAPAAASGLGLILLLAPWPRWGWHPQAWIRAATVVPGTILLLLAINQGFDVKPVSLLLVAAFYAFAALRTGQIRYSYISLGLLDWVLLRFISASPYSLPIGIIVLSALYGLQVDPTLRQAPQRQTRHWLRCLAVGSLCLSAFIESGDTFLSGLLVAGLGLALVGIGIISQTRAYLYVGTITFLLAVIRQIGLFLLTYSLLLWILGFIVGILLVWVAATLETRRAQVGSLLQTWLSALAEWR